MTQGLLCADLPVMHRQAMADKDVQPGLHGKLEKSNLNQGQEERATMVKKAYLSAGTPTQVAQTDLDSSQVIWKELRL